MEHPLPLPPAPIPQAPRENTPWGSIWQMTLSLIAAGGLAALAGVMLLSGLLYMSNPTLGSPTQALSMAVGMGGVALLVLPSAWYAWRRISGHPPVQVKPMNLWLLTLVTATLLPIVFVVGHLLSGNAQVSMIVLPIFNLIAVGLPILWLVKISTNHLNGGTAQRQWGIFATSLALTPLLIVVIELAVFALLGVAVMVWLATQPDLLQELTFLVQRLRYAPPTEEAYLRILGPYLSRPGVILSIFVGVSVVAPLVEETFKPLALWLLAGRHITPAQGFVGGMLSGAAFALVETLNSTSAGGPEWALTAASRITTAVLHMLASGLVGYGLVSAWKEKQYLRLGLAYMVAFTIHGLWNGLAVLGFTVFGLPESLSLPAPLPQWGAGAILGLGLLAVLNPLMLFGFPRLLPRQPVQARPAPPPTPTIEPPSLPTEE